jgi:hypothetical protein
MAISNLGTINNLPASKKPSGYVDPIVATFTDWQYRYVLTLNVLKATVENGTAATTLANIIANATVGINKQIVDIVAADFLATATVTTYAELYDLNTNYFPQEVDNVYLTSTAPSYVCKVILYVKAN